MEASEEEDFVVSDGSGKNSNSNYFGLPLAAVFCIAIVVYGLAVIICLCMRQIILKRRPWDTLESLHCCDCLLLWPKPSAKFCRLPCDQPSKSDELSWKIHLESLWTRLSSARCRAPDGPRPSCWPPCAAAGRAECPSSVRCCGLEIRRDTELARPSMVDASVSSGDVLERPAAGDGPTAPPVTWQLSGSPALDSSLSSSPALEAAMPRHEPSLVRA